MRNLEILIIGGSASKVYIYFTTLRGLAARCYTADNFKEAELHFKLAYKIKVVLFFLSDRLLKDIIAFNNLASKYFKQSTVLLIIGNEDESLFQKLFYQVQLPIYAFQYLPPKTNIRSIVQHINKLNTD